MDVVLIIGKVPLKIDGAIKLITPVFKNHIETDEHSDYINYKKYKNKFTLCDYFYIENNTKYYYKDYISDIDFINISNYVFTNTSIINDNISCDIFLDSAIIKCLKEFYEKDLVVATVKDVFAIATKYFETQEEYEDYDFSECFKAACDELLKVLTKDPNENVAKIYLIQSILYPGFINYYNLLYKTVA